MNFVLPDGTVFGDGDLILRPEMVRADLSCASRGSLQDWQDQVARYAVGNSRIAFFLAAGFAGPLLEFISEPSGGLHLFGPSRIGKTTAAVCRCISHWQGRSWRRDPSMATHGQRIGSCGGRQLGQPACAG